MLEVWPWEESSKTELSFRTAGRTTPKWAFQVVAIARASRSFAAVHPMAARSPIRLSAGACIGAAVSARASGFCFDPRDVTRQWACCQNRMEPGIGRNQHAVLGHRQREVQTVMNAPIEHDGELESGRATAWGAIRISSGPIGVPARSSLERTSAYTTASSDVKSTRAMGERKFWTR